VASPINFCEVLRLIKITNASNAVYALIRLYRITKIIEQKVLTRYLGLCTCGPKEDSELQDREWNWNYILESNWGIDEI
jgi:hypothetical protein